jgi:hypothetical protein
MRSKYTVVANSVDPRGLHLIHEDPAENWVGGSAVLKGCGHWIGFDTAMQMFISQYEFMAYAHDIYGYGMVSWASAQEARADAELAAILLSAYIHLMNYEQGCAEMAIEEMKQSKRKWFPLFAHCHEIGNYSDLALM